MMASRPPSAAPARALRRAGAAVLGVVLCLEAGRGFARSPVPGTPIVNQASVQYADIHGNALTAESPVVSSPISAAPRLRIEKSVDSDPVAPGATFHYTIGFENTGNASATNVTVVDTLPEGAVFQSATGSFTQSGRTLTWSLGALDSGASGSLVVTVQAQPGLGTGTVLTNAASISSAETSAESASVSTRIGAGANLLLVKTGDPAAVSAGGVITYRLAYRNLGNQDAQSVRIADLIPAGTAYVAGSATGSPTLKNGELIWELGTLTPGAQGEVGFQVRVSALAQPGSQISNLGSIVSASQAGVSNTVVTTVSSTPPRTQGSVAFYSGAWQPVIGYMDGERVNVQVTDHDQNLDPAAVETVTVVVDDLKTGDTETLILTETGPDTGIFRGGLPSSLGPASNNDGTLSVAQDTRIRATYTDSLDAIPSVTAQAMIDPRGTVFDSVTGKPIAGVVVTLRYWDNAAGTIDLSRLPELPEGQVNPALPTGADGKFAFPLAPAGDYGYEVTPPSGYAWPSAVPDADLPAGYTIGNGSRGEKFTLQAGDPPLIRDIPLDPPPGTLSITKTASKSAAAIGDLVAYTLAITNNGQAPVTGLVVTDVMPRGVELLPGSCRLDGKALPDPDQSGTRTFTWKIGDLAPTGVVEITYRAVVGPDSLKGDGINTGIAAGTCFGKRVASNRASVHLKLTGGVFTEKGTILGKVFLDRDGNRVQAAADSPEPGIPQVVLYLEDGTRVITDKNGKYSLLGVAPGNHVLRVDEATVPAGLRLVPLSGRFLGEGSSQFVDMKPGGLCQADFALEGEAGAVQAFLAARKAPAPAQAAFPGPGSPSSTSESGTVFPAASSPVGQSPLEPPRPSPRDWEQEIKTMKPGLEFLAPLDGSAVLRETIRVVLKAPHGTEPALTLNGTPVDAKLIGRRIDYPDGQVTVFEYLDIHLNAGEANLLRAEVKDPFGIPRGEARATVLAAGAPDRILLAADRQEVPADGSSRIQVSVSLQDKRGMAVPYSGFATVTTSSGELLGKDADPLAEDFQISLENGSASFALQAPRETGECLVTVFVEGREETVKVFFSPHLRNLFVNGLGEVVLGHGGLGGTKGDGGASLDARGAFFLKGKIHGDYLLTAAYDSDKPRQDALFRENDTNLGTEDKYPIYGDESKTGYEAVSRSDLYVKVEKNRSYLLFGDFRTGLDETWLSAYNRAFNGFKYELNTERFKVRSFASHTDQTQVVDILPGKGISGYYTLSQHPIVDGSEHVVIEVRDRQSTGTVLSRTSQSRGSDYEIDGTLGSILFKSPVPSYDADYNPVFVVVSYESTSVGDKYYTYGGRGAFRPWKWLELGATGIVEEKAIGNYHLLGTDLTLTLPRKMVLKAEYAETRSPFESSGLYEWQDGHGISFTAEGEPLDKLHVNAFYRELSDDYMNLSTVEASRGTTRYGLDASYAISKETLFRSHFIDERNSLDDARHRLVSIGAQSMFKKTKLSAELARESTSEGYVSVDPTVHTPFDIREDPPRDLSSLKLAMETALRPDLSLNLSHKQNLDGTHYSSTQAGMTYQIDSLNRAYLREEYLNAADVAETRTLMGVESQLIKNTVAFNEYRLADGADGARTQSVIGLRNKFLIGPSITANVSGEYLETLRGPQRDGDPDSLAATVGLEYLPREDFKLTTRLEQRRELDQDGQRSWLGEAGVAYKLNPDYSLLFTERYFTESVDDGRHDTSRTLAGLAYRPLGSNRFNALAKLEFKRERNTGATPSLHEDAYILSVEGIYQAGPGLQVSGKYAGKLSRDSGFHAYTDLLAGRVLYDLADQWDVGAECRVLTSHGTGGCSIGGSAEIGHRLMTNIWLSLGYSLDRFDSDLAGNSYQGKGPFLRLRFKFDERIFQNLHGSDSPDH